MESRVALVGEVTEPNCSGGASLYTSRDVFGQIDFPLCRDRSLFLCRMQPRVAEIGLLDDATHAHRNPRIQTLLQPCGVGGADVVMAFAAKRGPGPQVSQMPFRTL